MLEYHLAKAHWMASHSSVHSGPLHTYPDIFESATISFRIQKFPRPRVSIFKSNLSFHTQDSSGNIGNRVFVVKTGKSRVKSTRENFGTRLPS